jgi:hypothetical protein
MAGVVSQVAVETLIRLEPGMKISQVAVEALIRLQPPVKMSQLAVELLLPIRHDPYSFDIEFDL